VLIQIDAAQLEWRGAVWLSNDPVGLKEINDKVDAHTENQKTFALPTRDISKIYLFRTIFRGSGWSFANDSQFNHVSADPHFWDDVNKKFYTKYAGLDAWHHALSKRVMARLPIISPLGREWLIPVEQGGDVPWTTLSNYPVQGTCADIMTVVRVTLFRRLMSMKHLADVRLVSTVHDSIVLDVPAHLVEEVSKLAIACFDDLPKNFFKLWGIKLPIPFPGEVKAGPNLRDLKKL
jgi:DNA polymerase I-like protein with 3'-5' exonuclease and polymerase domains